MAEEKRNFTTQHNIIMENRRKLTVSGIKDVDSFDEQTVILHTELGELTVKGKDLHINSFNVDMGDISIEGEFVAVAYTNDQTKNSSLFSKIFR
ncbi:MAG: sporulation protein YabP [bacterium]|nr:sporulation protein YabP [bacterium]